MECWGQKVIVVVSKIGSKNSAKSIDLLFDAHSPDVVVNFGSAGAVAPDISIGSIVVAQATAEYQKTEEESALFPCSEELIEMAAEFDEIQIGSIVSADRNIDNEVLKEQLYSKYQALCGDWESAVVTRLCKAHNVSATAFRVVTDFGNENLLEDFQRHQESVLKHGAETLGKFLSRWSTVNG